MKNLKEERRSVSGGLSESVIISDCGDGLSVKEIVGRTTGTGTAEARESGRCGQ